MYELNNINLLGNELITGYSLGAVGYQEVAAYQNDDSHDYGSFRPPTFDEVGGLPYTQRTQDAIMKPFSSATRGQCGYFNAGHYLILRYTKTTR